MNNNSFEWQNFPLREFRFYDPYLTRDALQALREWADEFVPDDGEVAEPSDTTHAIETAHELAVASKGRRDACFHDLETWIEFIQAVRKDKDGGVRRVLEYSGVPFAGLISKLPLALDVETATNTFNWKDDGSHDIASTVRFGNRY